MRLINIVIFAVCFIASVYAASKYNWEEVRDPFLPRISPTGASLIEISPTKRLEDLRLEGIILDCYGESMALVNGRIVRQGEKIGNFLVVSIGDRFIILLKGQRQYILEMEKTLWEERWER